MSAASVPMTQAQPSPSARPLSVDDLPTEADSPTVFVHPGQLFVSSEPVWISTILGTCVAVCLYDAVHHVGGLNHYLLPHWAGSGLSSTKFGNVAIEALIAKTLNAGASKGRLEAKVFGGMSPRGAGAPRDLGGDNAQLAFKLLQDASIPVIAQSVGGQRGRRVLFNLKDGSTWVKQF